MKRYGVALAAGIAVFSGVVARAQTTPDPAAMTAREIALLQFYGGGTSLSPAERQQAAEIVQSGLRSNPRAMIAADAEAAHLLATLAKADAPGIALARATGRLNAALHRAADPSLRPQQDAEARIIETHDHTIVLDAAHQHLISEQTLKVLERANTAGARVFDVPPPGPDTADALRVTLRTQYLSLDASMQDALAHAEQNLPYAAAYLQQAQPEKRATFIAQYRQQILAGPTPADQQFRLAEVMVETGQAGSRHAGQRGGGTGSMLAGRLQSQMLLQHQLMGAARSFSPSCNVATGAAMANFTACHP